MKTQNVTRNSGEDARPLVKLYYALSKNRTRGTIEAFMGIQGRPFPIIVIMLMVLTTGYLLTRQFWG